MPIFNLARAIGANDFAADRVFLVPEHVLDTCAYFRARRIRGLPRFRQSMAAHRAPAVVASQTTRNSGA
jgi:hypothetical protein